MEQQTQTKRFPRSGKPASWYAEKLLEVHPLPLRDDVFDGPTQSPYGPEHMLRRIASMSVGLLRKLCAKHQLRTGGSKLKLMRRYYLLWVGQREGREEREKSLRERRKEREEKAAKIRRFPRREIKRFPRKKK